MISSRNPSDSIFGKSTSRRRFLETLGGGAAIRRVEARSSSSGADTRQQTTTREERNRKVLYLYGDVAADGTVPSGEATPFHQMRLSDTGPRGLSKFRRALEEVGFLPTERYDADTTLSRSLLEEYGMLILGSNQHRFDEAEREAVDEWVTDGGGLLAWSDSAFGGDYRQVGVCNPAGSRSNNDLTVQFGMSFLRDNGGGNYRVRQYTDDHFLNAGNRNGGIVFRGEGVSCVRVRPPAKILAKFQSGGLNGKFAVCKQDAPYRPDRDAALAVATIGDGRVVGTFDRNTFWNAGAGTNISQADNREYAQRLVLWGAGVA
ncbi:DUF4350 domain-containing protein [Halorussus salinisoli]|uniref:DUF4350 domain-containing protein n=1 Tax=Halorussus salinisoli TaxID=2558242 RepID=UPI002A9115DB|nr:DUF4350 domain-containing protein [Halorussus salinisoli]